MCSQSNRSTRGKPVSWKHTAEYTANKYESGFGYEMKCSAKNETPLAGCFRFWRNERVGFGPTCPRGKRAECQHSVLSGEAGNEASLLARKGE